VRRSLLRVAHDPSDGMPLLRPSAWFLLFFYFRNGRDDWEREASAEKMNIIHLYPSLKTTRAQWRISHAA